MKYLKGFLLTILATTVAAKCGPGYGSCGNGKCCSKYGYCGTSNSYCGKGCQADYGICNSSSGSQNTTTKTNTTRTKTNSATSTNGRCGSKYGSCPNNECCSKYGYCGTTRDHCASGCQSSYGMCINTPSTTKSSSATSTNGRCGSEYGSCPSGYCCSKYGYCGTSRDHCGSSCQSEYGQCNSSSTKTETTTTKTKTSSQGVQTSTNGKCGSQDGICPDNQCCSKYGYCGTSNDHCGTGCQSEFGQCNSHVTYTTKTKTKTTTTTTTKKSSSTNLPVSTSGLCGEEDGICPNHQCCSKYGYCGSTDDYCSASAGCQSEFGRCGKYVSNSKFKYYYECNDPKHWALSFDDGPYEYDNDLLDLLKEKGVKATFFLNGANVMDIKSSKGRSIVKRMYNEGHVIGSHTWSHANLEELDRNGIVSEMTKLEDALYDIIGKKPALMRPPYGAGSGSDEIASILSDLGYNGACIWNVDTLDWSTKGDIDYALDEFKRYQGKPIMSLNHCFYSGISKKSLVELARAEIDYMKSKGYTPVTMDVCLGLNAYQ